MFQTTRRRLALWYTSVTAVVLLLFATGVYGYVRTTLVERVDDTLNHVVEIVQRSLVIEPGGSVGDRVLTSVGVVAPPLRVNVEASFRNNAQTLEDDHIDLEWFSPNGEPLWSTLAAPLALPLRVNPLGETVRLPGEQVLRQVTERVVVNNQVLGYLRVSHPWFEVTKPSRQLLQDLCLGISLMLAVVATIGWLLSGIAIAPVRDAYQQLKQFTADASHELRNPIAVIQTNVQVALADPEPDAIAQHQQLQVIERLTRRLGRLVDDLLFLTRQEGGLAPLKREAVEMSGLLAEVVEEQAAIAEERQVTLTCEICQALKALPEAETLPSSSPLSWQVTGDADQLVRLFTNLVGNSLQYTPSGGHITLTLTSARLHNQPAVQIQVTDTGMGIAEDALSHVFERFYRVDPARPRLGAGAAGSGLGLAIAKVIVDNHRGDIQLKSIPQQGTTVTVWLPLRLETGKGRDRVGVSGSV